MTEEQLKNLLKQKSRQAILGELMSGICHEFNNPLTILLGNLGILEKMTKREGGIPTEKTLYFTGEIGSSSQRIQKIISTLRAVSKADQVETIQEESVDDMIEQVIVFLKTKISRGKVDIKLINFPTEKRLICSAGLFIECFLHLFNNALEALEMQTEKWIALEAITDEKGFSFILTDSGKAVFTEKMFIDLYTTKSNHAGMGLSIVKDALIQADGKIEIITHNNQSALKIIFPKREGLV